MVKLWEKILTEGNERLDAKALAVYHIAEGDRGELKIPPDISACVSLPKCP